MSDVRPARNENDDNKDFIIKENKAYTSDNVLIHKIFLNWIPAQFSNDDVQSYFSTFGKLLDVTLVEYKSLSPRAVSKVVKEGYVTFEEPESACSVLRKKNHCLQGLSISVMPAESWIQPSAYKARGPMKDDDDVPSTSKGSSENATVINIGNHLLSLNDYCIEAIFGYLEPKEQVRFARVCERLHDIFQIYCKRKYKNVDLNDISEMALCEIRDFFRFAGKNVVSITGTVTHDDRERIFEIISTFCGNLKHIELHDTIFGIECLKKIWLGCPHLEKLDLSNCPIEGNTK